MIQGGREERRPAPLSELVDDVSAEELGELARVDAILRSVPGPPPALPPSLRHPAPPREPVRLWTRRRTAVALAFAAVVAASFFGLGRLTGADSDSFDARAAIPMEATKNANGASALIKLGPADPNGNRTLRLRVSGLKPLPNGGYYILWLAKGRDYAATCGTFSVGKGETEAEWTVSYRLRDYDAWVVTARLPNQPRPENPPWLLKANI